MAKYPVIVHGASGYTGMLIIDWLIDQRIPFTAIGRSAERIEENMRERVVRLESAEYEIVECEHDVDALDQGVRRRARSSATRSARSSTTASIGVEAALRAGCHHLDTTGEQSYVLEARDQFGAEYAKANLVLRPVDVLHVHDRRDRRRARARAPGRRHARDGDDLPRPARGRRRHGRLDRVDLQPVPPPAVPPVGQRDGRARARQGLRAQRCPSSCRPVFALPWSGTSLPAFYEHDPRVRYCHSLVGFYDNQIMRDGRRALGAVGGRVQGPAGRAAGRRHRAARRVDDADRCRRASAPRCSGRVDVADRPRPADQRPRDGLQRHARTSPPARCRPRASSGCSRDDFAKPGFTSACKAFGHRYLLGFLEQRGLARATVV